MTTRRSRRKFPQLANAEIKYSSVFYEGMHDDSRTNVAVAQTAAVEGAYIVNYCAATALLRETPAGLTEGVATPASGRVVGAQVKDHVSGKEFTIRAKSVLLCGGPFTDELRKLEDPNCQTAINGASGIHIVLPSYFAPSNIGLVDMSTSDGRFMFFLPWKGHVVVGTTDHHCKPTMRPVADESVSAITFRHKTVLFSNPGFFNHPTVFRFHLKQNNAGDQVVAARSLQVPQPRAAVASPGRAQRLGGHPAPRRGPARLQHSLGQQGPRRVAQPRHWCGLRLGRQVDHLQRNVSCSL